MSTKKLSAFIVFVVAIGLLFPMQGWSIAPETTQGHLTLAQTYQEKADAQRQLIAEHERMKADYKEQVATSPKFSSSLVAKMNEHCDAIIAKAKDLAAEFAKFSEWHKMRAKELEG